MNTWSATAKVDVSEFGWLGVMGRDAPSVIEHPWPVGTLRTFGFLDDAVGYPT